jgi:O-antigen ligase
MRMIAGGYYRVNGFSFSIIGISGYAEIYTASIIFPMIFGSIPLLKGRNKVFSILLSILVTVYVFMSALATAMIIILLGIILVLYFRLSKKKKALLLPIIVLLLAVISNGKIASQALMNTAGIINIPKYDQKIIDIVKSIDSNEATGLVEDRTMRYEKSIESFVSNPIIGIGFDRNSPFEVGDHATVIDIFGTLGILGGLPFVFFIYYSYIICKKRWENTPYFILVKVSFINFIVIASVKSIMSSYPIFLTIVLFIPIIPHYIERLRNNTAQ